MSAMNKRNRTPVTKSRGENNETKMDVLRDDDDELLEDNNEPEQDMYERGSGYGVGDSLSLSRESIGSEGSSSGIQDEVRVVNKLSQVDTNRIRLVRCIVLGLMCAAAVAVTWTTYTFLKNAEQDDFENAFDQFGATLASSSLDQQQAMRQAFKTMASVVTAGMESTNSSMPYYMIPRYESFASELGAQAHMELMSVMKRAEKEDLEPYAALVDQVYEDIIAESHAISPGFPFKPEQYTPYIKKFVQNEPVPDNTSELYYLQLHRSPPFADYRGINWNAASVPNYAKVYKAHEILQNETLFAAVQPFAAIGEQEHARIHSQMPGQSVNDHPHSCVSYPIHSKIIRQNNDEDLKIVAVVQGCMAWDAPLRNLIPKEITGIVVVIQNNCNQSYTYRIDGPDAFFLGEGDLHDPSYHRLRMDVDFSSLYTNPAIYSTPGHCMYNLTVYPSKIFEDNYVSNTPEIYVSIMAITFFLMIMVFAVYDILVQIRNRKLVNNAAQSNAIVSSMFPSNIRDRLFPGHNDSSDAQENQKLPADGSNKSKKKEITDKPIADLFLETTIMFADITGFTAWSSVREPSQVFTLLETVFSALDRIAKKRKIFKVETVGDCYVAVAGLPDPAKDHAVLMARFANDTLATVQKLVKRLELSLGPDTGDLGVRIGLHSGVVTAGVLRGDRARFQLFGDTVNTTARIESTGQRNRIHVSKETADSLIQAGKDHWIKPRKDLVLAKGKGTLQTFWLNTKHTQKGSGLGSGDSEHHEVDCWADAEVPDKKEDRLIDWQVDVFTRLLKQVMARRNASEKADPRLLQSTVFTTEPLRWSQEPGHTCLDEVKEIITLPEFDGCVANMQEDLDNIELGEAVMKQLRSYISTISSMYRKNDFHSFEHACHVTMSVTKLLSRIVAPSDLHITEESETDKDENPGLERSNSCKKLRFNMAASTLHDHTYGITSDPLTQFAMVFSALIHDVDHTGVPNARLLEENKPLATMYRNKSVAEQNSIDLAWKLLEDDSFSALRACIYSTKAEFNRFRQLVVQAVLATDIADKELKVLRNARWDHAFAEENVAIEENPRDTVNRKATIVIEHLIQASDVAHTMQHWYVYRKWNEKFFRECYKAYLDGRAESDPSLNWYKGEIGFFDFYIIPLARMLKKCGVFGVSSDEYLNYALQNRQEWEDRGREVVEEMINSITSTTERRSSELVASNEPTATTAVTDTDDVHDDDSFENEPVNI
ncbi:hypothetical protein ACA910_005691 [Epithemia clementina (nom. ined.)]